jgi:hypothetical protein
MNLVNCTLIARRPSLSRPGIAQNWALELHALHGAAAHRCEPLRAAVAVTAVSSPGAPGTWPGLPRSLPSIVAVVVTAARAVSR